MKNINYYAHLIIFKYPNKVIFFIRLLEEASKQD